MTTHLYLLRHGDALDSGATDADRNLSLLGERQARIAGRFLKSIPNAPDVILASPLHRARRMAELAGKELGLDGIVVSEFLIPGMKDQLLIDEINTRGHRTVLLVGHEPQIRRFSAKMTGERSLHLDIQKGTMVYIECPTPLTVGNGTLRWLMTNEEMESGARPG